jgi:hypothetical protein
MPFAKDQRRAGKDRRAHGGLPHEFLGKHGLSKTEAAKIIERVLAEEGHTPECVFDFAQAITAIRRSKSRVAWRSTYRISIPHECGDSKVVRNAPHASSPAASGHKASQERRMRTHSRLSYCIKFVTYDRLPRAVDGGKGKPVSLKGAPLAELAAWRAQYSPDDFLFLYGAKRLNRRFVRLARTA